MTNRSKDVIIIIENERDVVKMEKEKVIIAIDDFEYKDILIIEGSRKEYELLKAIKERGFFDAHIEIKIISDDYIIEV